MEKVNYYFYELYGVGVVEKENMQLMMDNNVKIGE